MKNNSKNSAIVKSIVLAVLGAVVLLGFYLMVTRSHKSPSTEEYILTVIDEITTTNLEKNYPADPRMVVELYGKIMKVMYKEGYTDEQQDRMIEVLGGIMDDELMANQSNFAKSIKDEVKEKKEGDYSISTYVVQTREPEQVKVGGKKMCTVDCQFYLRKGSTGVPIYYQFVLRRDDNGKWKILGWEALDNN